MSGLTATQRAVLAGLDRLHEAHGHAPLPLTSGDVARLAQDAGLTVEQVRLAIEALHTRGEIRAEPHALHIALHRSDPILIYPDRKRRS